MKKKVLNPWKWQDKYGFAHAVEISEMQRFLLCAGQTSVNEDGVPLHVGDMAKQIIQSLDNLETLLDQANMNLSNVVHFKYYTTDIAAFIKVNDELDARLKQAGCERSSTLIGVTELFHPDILVEIEATAVA